MWRGRNKYLQSRTLVVLSLFRSNANLDKGVGVQQNSGE